MTVWVRVGEEGTTGELGSGGELQFLSDGGVEGEHEGEGTEGRRWRRRGEERRERRGMTRLGEGRGLRGGRGFLKNYDDFFKYRPDSEFFLLHVIIKYNSGFHTQNIRTCLLFLGNKLDCELIPRKP